MIIEKDILVSIITVVYNGEQFLEQTIQSVINQSYNHIEYIIIDGGSTDGTIDIIKKYESRIAFWISEEDTGLYDAMNKGIEKATGDLIGMINSDDWYEDNIVELMVDAYRNNRTKKIFHADRFDIMLDGKKKVYKHNESALKFIFLGMTYNHPTMFVSKEVYEQFRYNTVLQCYSDYQFVLEVYLKDRNIFFHIAKPLVNYRLDGISAQIGLKQRLMEGFEARKNAGLDPYRNMMSLALRFVKPMVYYIWMKFRSIKLYKEIKPH